MTRQARADGSPDRGSGQVAESKREARGRFLERRQALSDADAAAASLALCKRFEASPEFERAPKVVLYATIPGSGELDLGPVFERLRAGGRRVLYPRCADSGRLEFVEVPGREVLRPGRHGIPEPEGTASPLTAEEDLVLVPGLAFDREGFRLGFGRGYYDRTFAAEQGPSPRLFGVGYSWQLTERLPREFHDRPMDGVLTDRETLRLRDLRAGDQP